MSIISEVREKQNELIVMINTTFDEIVMQLEKQGLGENPYEAIYESEYPITNATGFKGKKPIAVKIENKRIMTPTWKTVVETILKEVMKEDEMKNKIMGLNDKLLGKVRSRLSKDATHMRSPMELCDGLYIETHYDTETLMKLLIQILKEISYDYSHLRIIIKN